MNNEITALSLIANNTAFKAMLPRAHVIFNAGIGNLLARGLVVRDTRSRTGYALTARGRVAVGA